MGAQELEALEARLDAGCPPPSCRIIKTASPEKWAMYSPAPSAGPSRQPLPPPEPRKKWPPTKTIYFRFGSRILCATGEQSDHAHPHVLRLSVHATILGRVVGALFHLLPCAARSWVQARFPEWVLPTKIVLKKQKEDWEEEYDTEVATYEKLRCLQGHVIPIFYGQTEYDGARAIVLSDVGGACVAEPEGAVLDENEFRRLIEQALGALCSLGIVYDDLKLDNFRLVGKGSDRRVIVVDLERVDEFSPKDKLEWGTIPGIEFLMDQYRDHLDCLRHDGLLIRPS